MNQQREIMYSVNTFLEEEGFLDELGADEIKIPG